MADHDCVMSSIFMEVLDTTVVNVSLPHIAGDLSATDEATWTLTSYPVANAIILPMTGWLATTFGHKRLLMLSVIEFTAASFFVGDCAAADGDAAYNDTFRFLELTFLLMLLYS
jgi:MFS family permease